MSIYKNMIFHSSPYKEKSVKLYQQAKKNGEENPEKHLKLRFYRITAIGSFSEDGKTLRVGFTKTLAKHFSRKLGNTVAIGRLVKRPMIFNSTAPILEKKDQYDFFKLMISPFVISPSKFNRDDYNRSKPNQRSIRTNRAAEAIHETIRQIKLSKTPALEEVISFEEQ